MKKIDTNYIRHNMAMAMLSNIFNDNPEIIEELIERLGSLGIDIVEEESLFLNAVEEFTKNAVEEELREIFLQTYIQSYLEMRRILKIGFNDGFYNNDSTTLH